MNSKSIQRPLWKTEAVPLLRCRVHMDYPVRQICLDSFCGFQRLLCPECEQSEHYLRHRSKCIPLSDIMSKAEQRMSLPNWPQDRYLHHFQQFLISQSIDQKATVIEMCSKLRNQVLEKIDEVQSLLIKFAEEQHIHEMEKVTSLMNSYLSECCDLTRVRKLIEQLAQQGKEVSDTQYKNLVIEKEKSISSFIKEFQKKQQDYKEQLNQVYGFGYFDSLQSKWRQSIDFSLVEQEFENIQASLTQMMTFIQKNMAKPMRSEPVVVAEDNMGEDTPAQSMSKFNLILKTDRLQESNITFRQEERWVYIRKPSRPTYFYTNVLPQQCMFQVRFTGGKKCGTYLGLIKEEQKSNIIQKEKEGNSHFVGVCLKCPYEYYGGCRTSGPGVNINYNKVVELSYNNSSDYDNFHDELDELEREQDNPDAVTVLNVYVNLKKKMISISDISLERYVKFNLDDNQFFYNNNVCLFVQTASEINFEILEFSSSP